jgi:hypothetical protein
MKKISYYNIILVERTIFRRFNYFLTGKNESPIKKVGDKDVIFIHINKTAGTSIGKVLGLREKQHLTVQEVRNRVGVKNWNNSYTIAFVRNPWDRMVSYYRYRVKTPQKGTHKIEIDFKEWIIKVFQDRDPRYYDYPKMFMPQVDWLKDEFGDIEIDFIGRFETIEKDFKELCKELDVQLELPHLNKTKQVPYQKYYDEETRQIVAEYFAEDIETFGYSF